MEREMGKGDRERERNERWILEINRGRQMEREMGGR